MPTEDYSGLSKPCYGCGEAFKGNSPRWQAAISTRIKSLDRPIGQERGASSKIGSYHWVSACTPCFWASRTPKGVGVRGPVLEGEIR